jgi:hypothetical protein
MGYPSVIALLQAIPEVIQVRGKHRAKRVMLTGQAGDDTSSLDESYRSQKSRQDENHNNNERKSFTTPKGYSADRPRFASTLMKQETRRWSESPKHIRTHKPIPPPLFSPCGMGSPGIGFHGRQGGQDNSIFTFDRAPPLSPPVRSESILFSFSIVKTKTWDYKIRCMTCGCGVTR